MARRGASVRVFDPAGIGAGASGGHLGALAPHAPERWNDKKAFQLDSLLMAPGFWADVEAASGLSPGYARTGRLQPVAEPDRLTDRIAASRDRWPPGTAMRLTDAPKGSLVPRSPSGVWVQDGLTARLSPRAACAALAAAIRSRGGTIVAAPPPDRPGGPVLWATGTAGLADLSRDLGRPVGTGVKGQSALLRFAAPADDEDAPQVFADGLHIVAHADGTVAVGATSETAFDHLDPDEQLDTLIARARAVCPQLRDAPVIDRWAEARPRARSRAPILGPWPGRPGHFVANGGFKIGFGMAPKIARVMADLILEGRDTIPDGFRLA